MASCLDFAEEMTALQHVGNELGIAVIISPKFHAKLAGEGIEYSWDISKALYRRKPLHSKRSKESFKRLVLECTRRQQVLQTATVRPEAFQTSAGLHMCILRTLREQQG